MFTRASIHPITFLCACICSFSLHAQTYQWTSQMGGLSRDEGSAVALDPSGNIILGGSFWGTADLDPGPGSLNLTSQGNSDLFIQKLDSSGNLLWVRQMGGEQQENIFDLTVDAQGNIYAVGWFRDTADFDPGLGTANLISHGFMDIFVLKLDKNGEYEWARSMGGGDMDEGDALAVDNDGNVYTVGTFRDRADFDPGVDKTELVSAGDTDIFIQKLDSNGKLVWVKQIGAYDQDIAQTVALDHEGNIFVSGSYRSFVDFDPGLGESMLMSQGESDAFTLKLNPQGEFVWVRQMGGPSNEAGFDIALDADGGIITVGSFAYTADFDPGQSVYNLKSKGSWDIFIQKLDGNGNFVWAHSLGGDGVEIAYSMAMDTDRNIYLTGQFSGKADFDPGVDTLFFQSVLNKRDIFILKLNSLGEYLWAGHMGGIGGSDKGSSIAVGYSHEGTNVYATGQFAELMDFNPATGLDLQGSMGDYDIFLSRFHECAASEPQVLLTPGIQIAR